MIWNTIVSDPVGTVSFPCQVPEISCADAEEDKNSPVNNPVLIVAMQTVFNVFIRERLIVNVIDAYQMIRTKITIILT